MVVPLDNFDLVLGINFLRRARASLMPFVDGLLIIGGNDPCFMKCFYASKGLRKRKVTKSAMLGGDENTRKGTQDNLIEYS